MRILSLIGGLMVLVSANLFAGGFFGTWIGGEWDKQTMSKELKLVITETDGGALRAQLCNGIDYRACATIAAEVSFFGGLKLDYVVLDNMKHVVIKAVLRKQTSWDREILSGTFRIRSLKRDDKTPNKDLEMAFVKHEPT